MQNIGYKIFYGLFNFLCDLIYPEYCFYCKDFLPKRGDIFCKKCFDLIKPIVSIEIEATKKHKVKIFAISDYKFPVKSLILAKGSSDIVASRSMGRLAWDLTYIKNIDFDIIVPIPLYWKRYAERGYNQADQMAKEISKKSGKPVINLLKRIKSTRRQSELSPANRSINLHDAFEINKKYIAGYREKKILLVDDLFTTGSTIKFATKVLGKIDPKSVQAIVACRVV